MCVYVNVYVCVCVCVRACKCTDMALTIKKDRDEHRVGKRRDCVGAEEALTPKEHTQSEA